MIGDGTGSPLSVGEPLADGESAADVASEAVADVLGVGDAVGSDAVVSPPSSEPHATTVAATSASPAMATGIRVMGQVCLVVPTKIRATANLRGFRTVRQGEARCLVAPADL
jgi:hypothetical protein